MELPIKVVLAFLVGITVAFFVGALLQNYVTGTESFFSELIQLT